jgi:DNA-directed RNA polymerase subunit N (RpoN/RPB10)
MLKPVCSCGRLLADIQLDYERMIRAIDEEAKASEELKAEKKTQVLDKLHLKRYCCRSQVLGYVDLVDVLI